MMPLSLPNPFGPFRIVRKLGAGGMGDVYLAHDTRLGRTVALKIPRFFASDDSQLIDRFHREARIAAQVPAHPSLCPVHEVGCIEGVHFLAMAYIEGAPLSRYLGEACQWHPVHAVALICQLAEALSQLHHCGIVHRDIKASNVLLQPDGRAVLLDFGLARSFVSVTHPVSVPGQILGTPGTMAPEQVQGNEKKIGPPTDVWALGVLLYQLLTGHPPFGQGNPQELGLRILCVGARPPSHLRRGLDPRFDQLCAVALAKNPDDRPANGHVFLQMLKQLAIVPPVGGIVPPPTPLPSTISRIIRPSKRVSLIGLGAASVVLIGLLVGFAVGRRDDPVPTSETSQPVVFVPPRDPPAEPSAIVFHPIEPLTLTAGEQGKRSVRFDRIRANGNIELMVIEDIPDLQWRLPILRPGISDDEIAVQTSPAMRPGTYRIHVLASASGSLFYETELILVVKAPPTPELALKVPNEIKVVAGQSARVPLTMKHAHLKSPVSVAQKNQITGVECTSAKTDGGTADLELKTAFALSPGRYTVEVRAQADPGMDVVQTITLVVEAAPQAITNCVGMRLVLIPRGKVTIGASKDEQQAVEKALRTLFKDPDEAVKELLDPERQVHQVEISSPFYLGVYEVTQAEYEKVTGKNPSQFRAGGAGGKAVEGMDTQRLPVETVSWEGALDFCKKLSDRPEEKQAGRVYRLPTSAEWEYACRAGSKTHQYFHYGDALDSTQANIIGTRPFGTDKQGPYLKRPEVVGSYKANAWGLYDMHGNVWEWCSDWYDPRYYAESPAKDPTGPLNGVLHVRRGGSWHTQAIFCRSAFRMGLPEKDENIIGHIGFRVVCVQTQPK